MSPQRHALLILHLSAAVFGGTALFAKLIGLPADVITLWRSVVAVGVLVVWQRLRHRKVLLGSWGDAGRQVLLGVALGIHWWAYFEAIKVSNVAVSLVAVYTAPMLVVFLEPLLHRGRVAVVDVALALLVLAGVSILVPGWDMQGAIFRGVCFGLLSAAALALRNVLHRRWQGSQPPIPLIIHQMVGVCLLFCAASTDATWPQLAPQLWKLLLLGACFTALPHTLVVAGLRVVPARTATLIASLMVVYGALFAWLLLGETPAIRTALGGILVLGAATAETLRRQRAS